MKKMYSQPMYRVSNPPAISPMVAPPAPIPPQMPSALLRSTPSGNMFITIESAAGKTIAAPSPCSPRIAIKKPSLVANPAANDATVNTDKPSIRIRRRPSMSAARPPSSRKPPNVSP
jgi:hypothetical protein